jgi:hypothetical protein
MAPDSNKTGSEPQDISIRSIIEPHVDLKKAVIVIQMMSGTSAAKIPRWRSRCRNSSIQEINGEQITTIQDIAMKIREASALLCCSMVYLSIYLERERERERPLFY